MLATGVGSEGASGAEARDGGGQSVEGQVLLEACVKCRAAVVGFRDW